MGAASGIATTPELNDPQFWVRVGLAHGPQEIAQWRQSAAATIKWHLFSVNIEQLAKSAPAVQAEAIQKTVQQWEDAAAANGHRVTAKYLLPAGRPIPTCRHP